jgi:aromatic-L-amino-acid decarboxylase
MESSPQAGISPPSESGDMCAATFQHAADRLTHWVAGYLDGGASALPVMSDVPPGRVRDALSTFAPAQGCSFDAILDEFERAVFPGVTHWNHPGFMAYFPSSGSGPGVLAEYLATALNQQAMLWRTSPAATEVEGVALGWLRDLIGLPPSFEGISFEGGSISNLHGLLAAREAALPSVRTHGVAAHADFVAPRVYCSKHAHSSIDKAVIVLGLGSDSLRKVDVDGQHRMRAESLGDSIRADLAAGVRPVAVVATAGTTASGAFDPIDAIANICHEYGIWLHVDASWAGPAAMLPEHAARFRGMEQADSVVVNPHKWLFTPLDISAFYCRRMNALEAALALTPDYLAPGPGVFGTNPMDRGIPLGRRFRALKLWAVMKFFGVDGLRSRLRAHIELAHVFAELIRKDRSFQLTAPPSLSLVCFRAAPEGCPPAALDALNEALLSRVNATGEVLLSSARLDGHFTLRLVVGHVRTQLEHVDRAYAVLCRELRALSVRSRVSAPLVTGTGM